MDSLAKVPPEQGTETKDAADHQAGHDAASRKPEATPANAMSAAPATPEMSAEEFYAVEEAAMRAEIADYESDVTDGSDNGDHDAHVGLAADSGPGLARGVNEAPEKKWSEAVNARTEDPRADTILPIEFPKVAPEAATVIASAAAAPTIARAAAPVPLDHEDPPVPAARYEHPAARISAAPTPPMQPAAALPIRLRERLEAAERAEEASGNRTTAWLIGAAVVAAVAIGVVLFMRYQKPEQAARGTSTRVSAPAPAKPVTDASNTASMTGAAPVDKPAAAVAAVPAPSVAVTPPASSTAPAHHAASPASATTIEARTPSNPSAVTTRAAATTTAGSTTAAPPVVKPAAPHVAPKATAVAKPATPKAQFGISVASFLAEDRATSELARLKAATGLTGRVMPTKDGDYRVVLGSFPDRGAAEDAAGNLIGSGKVDEARVLSLGSAPAKR